MTKCFRKKKMSEIIKSKIKITFRLGFTYIGYVTYQILNVNAYIRLIIYDTIYMINLKVLIIPFNKNLTVIVD